jgi:hypothetical protein
MIFDLSPGLLQRADLGTGQISIERDPQSGNCRMIFDLSPGLLHRSLSVLSCQDPDLGTGQISIERDPRCGNCRMIFDLSPGLLPELSVLSCQ